MKTARPRRRQAPQFRQVVQALLKSTLLGLLVWVILAAAGNATSPAQTQGNRQQPATPPLATVTPAPRRATLTPTPTRPRLESDEDVIGVLAPRDLRPRDNDIRFDHLTLEHGLSQSSVYAILQDYQGFMWLGTEDGLNKYDGYGFTVYRHDPRIASSLSHNHIRCLHEDGQGMLWIGTMGGGLNRLDPETGEFTHYLKTAGSRAGLAHDSVLVLYEDRQGVLWVATAAGLDQFDRHTDSFVHFQHNPHASSSLGQGAVTAIFEDRQSRFWVGTTRGGLNELDRATNEFTHYSHDPDDAHSLSSNHVTAIFEDSMGNLWVGTNDGGLDRLDRDTGQFMHNTHDPGNSHSLSNDSVTAIYEDSSDILWVATSGGGLQRLERETGEFIQYRHDPSNVHSLSHDDVLSIYEDRGGVLWIGTLGGGLNKASRANQKFAHYRQDPNDPNSLGGNRVHAIWEDQEGTLWVGCEESGLSRLDRSTGEWTHFRHDAQDPSSLSHDSVWCIYEDRSGSMWIGTEAGLDRYEEDDSRFVHYHHDSSNLDSLTPGGVHAIYEDKQGALWVGTMGGGLSRLDLHSGHYTRYEYDPSNPFGLSHDSVQCLHESYDGSLWVGTMGGGLNRLDPETGRFSHYRHNPNDPNSIGSDMIFCITEDYRGRLFIGTWGAGFDRFDPQGKRFIHYREADGLPNDVVYGIAEDTRGDLWLSTNRGLSRFDPTRQTFRNYDVSDGLQSNEFHPGAYHVTDNGELFFGGIDGLNVFFPPNVEDNPHVPPVVITAFRKFDRTVLTDISEDLSIELSYNDNFIAFEFAALDYTAPHKNQYTYRLEGFDPRWVDAGTRRYQSYSNLTGGDYVFRVRGSNNDGVWNQEGIAVHITVIPPVWDRLWFRALLGLLLFGSALAGYRLNVRSIQTRSHELEMQVDERTYEIQRRRLVAEGLREILMILNANRPLRETLDYIASQSALLTGADRAMVFRRDGGSGAPTVIGTYEPTGSRPTGRQMPPAMTRWLAETLMSGEPLIVPGREPCDDENSEQSLPPTDGERCAILGVPLSIAGQIYGGLALFFGEGRTFSSEDVELGLTLVDQAALAIANAQLRERVEHIAAEAERSRLARDLHDAVTQTLFSASLIAEVLPGAWEADKDEGRQLLKELRLLSRGAMAEMRTLLMELRPAALIEAPLGDLLRQLAEAVTGRTGLPVEVTVRGKCTLPDDVHVALYRIAQEALNNVMKHSHAQHVQVSLKCRSWHARTGSRPIQEVKLQVRDDGRGFDLQDIPPERLGLDIIRERAQAIGATHRLESELGAGTTVTAVWKG